MQELTKAGLDNFLTHTTLLAQTALQMQLQIFPTQAVLLVMLIFMMQTQGEQALFTQKPQSLM